MDIVRQGGKVYSFVKRVTYLYFPYFFILPCRVMSKQRNLIYGIATRVYRISVICVIL